jgi:hypothetical protein
MEGVEMNGGKLVRGFALSGVVVALFCFACCGSAAQVSPTLPEIVQPCLICRPDRLEFVVQQGQTSTLEATINILSMCGGVLNWSASDNVPWIDEQYQAVTDKGKNGVVRIIVDPSGMAGGEYTGIVTVTAEGALGSPYHIPVFLTVSQPGAGRFGQDKSAVPESVALALPPADSAVVWKNQNDLVQYASTSSCVVSGSITNTDKWWYMKDVTISASTGSALIITTLPPGETVIYSRFIPCFKRENVKLTYNWFKP